tara:strand:- start:2044 stop:3891 length:1848 start_codon:yes stop_codon:yes gene_type:complete
MEWRETQQSDQHCQLAVNVDLSRGYIEPRPGFEVLYAGGDANFRGRLHITDSPIGDRVLLKIGYSTSESATIFRAFSLDVSELGNEQNLDTAFGDMSNPDFRCSFVNITLPNEAGDARFVTLVFTDTSTYVYDPISDTAPGTGGLSSALRAPNLAKIESGGDTIRLNDKNFSYYKSVMGGYIATEHQGKVFRAGFARGTAVSLSSTLEQNQNLVPESIIDPARGSLTLGPHHVTYSDEFDPLAIQAHHVFSVEEYEVITGLIEFQENLVVLTDESVYMLSGGTDADYQLYRVASGVGCVSHSSLVVVGGSLYFLGFDGIYRYTGGTKAEKISTPIEEIWTGRYTSTYVADEVASLLSGLGYPWRIDYSALGQSCGVHYHEADQIWWTIPIKGMARRFSLTLVWHITNLSWTVYASNPDLGGVCSPIDAVVDRRMGKEVLYSVSTVDSISRYGTGWSLDGTSGGAMRGIPMVWGSARLFKGNTSVSQFRPFRFRLLGKGVTPDTNPPRVAITGDEAASDQGSTEMAANLATHPNPGFALGGDEKTNYFWGDTGRWDTVANRAITLTPVSWFTAKVDAKIRSRSIMIWIVDDRDDEDGHNLVTLQDFSFEVHSGDSR